MEVVGELPRSIQSLFSSSSTSPPRVLLGRLQLFGKVVQTSLDRPLTTSRRLEILAIQRLLTLSNPIRHAIASERSGGLAQLAGGALLPLTLSCLVEVLLQTTDRIGESILSLCDLISSLLSICILIILATASRQVLD